MYLIKLLIIWPCFIVTMEQPNISSYPYLYSNVEACTRYNFLPINTKNFREAVLFFNLCEQLIHLLPAEQRKDYAKYLKREIIMTKNEFMLKHENKDIAMWLDTKVNSIVHQLNKLQEDPSDGHKRRKEHWPLLPSIRPNFFKKDRHHEPNRRNHHWNKTKNEESVCNSNPMTLNHEEHNDSVTEEKVNMNDIALIGLVLGLVSTLSAVFTLLYICYCGSKRAKKKVLLDPNDFKKCKQIEKEEKKKDKDKDKDKGKCEDKEALIPKHSKATVESQTSCKNIKYNEGPFQLYHSVDGAPQIKGDVYGNYEGESSITSSQNVKNTYTIDSDFDQNNENLQYEMQINPEEESIYSDPHTVHLDSTPEINNRLKSNETNEIAGAGYQGVDSKDSYLKEITPHQPEYLTMPVNESASCNVQYVRSKTITDAYERPRVSYDSNNFTPQRLSRHSRINTAASLEPQKGFLAQDDKKTSPSFSYIQQKYSKGQVPLINSHFPMNERPPMPIPHQPYQQQQIQLKQHLQQQLELQQMEILQKQQQLQQEQQQQLQQEQQQQLQQQQQQQLQQKQQQLLQQEQQQQLPQQHHQELQQHEKQTTETMSNQNSSEITVLNSEGKESSTVFPPRDAMQAGESVESNKCKNCKKRISGKKKIPNTCENPSTLIRMKMEANKKGSGVEKVTGPVEPECSQTESENMILHQEKFICSLSATTPLTTQEQFIKFDKNTNMISEISDAIKYVNATPTQQVHHPNGDLNSSQKLLKEKSIIGSTGSFQIADADTQQIIEQKQYYMSLHSPAVKKYHKQKCLHPKSPLSNSPMTIKKPQKAAIQEINSSYYSVQPNSPYQSCAEVNPIRSGCDEIEINVTDSTFSQKVTQQDFQRSLKAMFNKCSPTDRETGKLRR